MHCGAQRPQVQPGAQPRLMNHPEALEAQSPAVQRRRWETAAWPSWKCSAPWRPAGCLGQTAGGSSCLSHQPPFLVGDPAQAPYREHDPREERLPWWGLRGPGQPSRRAPSPPSLTPASPGSIIYVPGKVPAGTSGNFRRTLCFYCPAHLFKEPD